MTLFFRAYFDHKPVIGRNSDVGSFLKQYQVREADVAVPQGGAQSTDDKTVVEWDD